MFNFYDQPSGVFVGTGRLAYTMGIHAQDNPFKRQPYRDLWDKGWKAAKRKADRNRNDNRKDNRREKQHHK